MVVCLPIVVRLFSLAANCSISLFLVCQLGEERGERSLSLSFRRFLSFRRWLLLSFRRWLLLSSSFRRFYVMAMFLSIGRRERLKRKGLVIPLLNNASLVLPLHDEGTECQPRRCPFQKESSSGYSLLLSSFSRCGSRVPRCLLLWLGC